MRTAIGALAWLVVVALGTCTVVAQPSPPSRQRNAGATLDFAQEQEAVRAAFHQATTVRTPGTSEVAALAAFAELAYIESDEAERDELVKALQGATERASDSASRLLARGWLLQFRAFAAVNGALQTLGESAVLKHPLGASQEARKEALPPARKAVDQAKAAIAQMGKPSDRTVLETANVGLAALIDRMDRRNDQAIERLRPLWSRPARSAREVAVWLAGVRLAADRESAKDKSLGPRLDRLELAITQANAFWSSHPAIAETLQMVVELAAAGNLRARGRQALARLENDKFAPGPLELAKLAWELDDLPAGRRWFIKGVRRHAADTNTSSEEWKDRLQATVDFALVLGNPARRLLVISALLEERDIIPEGSPARRWALSALAQGYAEAGEPRVAAALAKTAAALPVPTKVADLLKTASDPKSLEKPGTEFESTPDLGARARLLEAAFEMRRKQKLPVDDSFVALNLLIAYKIKIGESKDVGRLMDGFLDYMRQTPLPPVSLDEGYDTALGTRKVGLESVAQELEAARLDPAAREVRRFLQDLIRERLRETVALHARSGKSPGEFLYKIDVVATDFILANRPRPALELYTTDALPIMLASGARPMRDGEGDQILESLAKVFTLLGENAIAQHMIRQTKTSTVRATEPADEVCRRLRTAARNSLAAPPPLANPSLTDLVSQLASFPCGDRPSEQQVQAQALPHDTLSSDWGSEEVRLRTISLSPETVAALRSESPARGCRATPASGSDERRRAFLFLLDEARGSALRNEVQEAGLMESLAASYPKESALSIALRRMAIDLLLDRSAAPVERIGQSAECLLLDMVDTGRDEEARSFISFINEKVGRREGEKGAGVLQDRLKPVLRKLPKLRDSTAAGQKTADLADLDRAVSDLKGRPADELRTRVIKIAGLVHALPAPAYQSKRLHELLASAQKAVADTAKPNHEIAGMIALLRAEAELTSGTVANALGFIEQAGKSRTPSGWNDLAAIDLRSRLQMLQQFAQDVASERQKVREEAAQLAKLEKRKAPAGELVSQLQKLVETAAQAHEYQVAVDALRRLARLEVPFEEREGFVARESLPSMTSAVARRCATAIPVTLGANVSPVLGECAVAAVRMAAVAAADKLRRKRERSRDEEDLVNETGGYDLKEVLQVLPPLLTGIASSVQEELGVLLRWFVAERSTRVVAATRGQIEDGAGAEGTAPTALRAWRKARADWLVQEGQYRCGLASGRETEGLFLLFGQADAARLSAEQAWSDLMASMPEGKALPPVPELDVVAIRKSLEADEAILSFAVNGNDVVIWMIRQDAIDLRLTRWDNPQEDVSGLLGQLSGYTAAGTLPPLRMVEARRIYEVLLAPLQDRLSGIHALFIETDATTARVPFAALIASPPPSPTWSVQETWTPDWLARRFAISLIPSMATFALQRIAPYGIPRRILAAGNPVDAPADVSYDNDPCSAALGIPAEVSVRGPAPGAREELDETMRLAGSQGQLLSQRDFVPEGIRRMPLRNFGLVIFATHGEPETYGLPARLVLSPSNPEATAAPTSLSATELMQLEFDADLVILSACSSGLSVGAGLNGLVTGFLRAGARQVIATAWPVGEQVAQVVTLPMVRHYLQNGPKNFDRAMQTALQRMIDTAGSHLRHPYFWAGIFLLGPSYRS
jgi:CHAT domain-containing protein